VLIISWHNQTI